MLGSSAQVSLIAALAGAGANPATKRANATIMKSLMLVMSKFSLCGCKCSPCLVYDKFHPMYIYFYILYETYTKFF
ncbi:MAG: hypothetical protein OHK0023_20750 [Anaerolineae bacterium]